jgi:hypothetical protein
MKAIAADEKFVLIKIFVKNVKTSEKMKINTFQID